MFNVVVKLRVYILCVCVRVYLFSFTGMSIGHLSNLLPPVDIYILWLFCLQVGLNFILQYQAELNQRIRLIV